MREVRGKYDASNVRVTIDGKEFTGLEQLSFRDDPRDLELKKLKEWQRLVRLTAKRLPCTTVGMAVRLADFGKAKR